jgi:Protein of unknown function (DUF2796)
MRRSICMVAVCLATASAPALAQQERREVGPHEHGAGTLNIAIEGGKVSMDLSAPANDVLGFEHQPSTPAQTEALAKAKELLAQPLKLIELPSAAGCTVESVNVTFNAAEAGGATPKAEPKKDESQHADFDVDYVLTCKSPEKIAALSFGYFKLFAGAQKLSVTVVSDKGQAQYDVTRDKPSVTLK